MKTKTLLEIAKEIPVRKDPRKPLNSEEKELVYAFLNGEIAYTQALKASGRKGMTFYSLIVKVIRNDWAKGEIGLIKNQ